MNAALKKKLVSAFSAELKVLYPAFRRQKGDGSGFVDYVWHYSPSLQFQVALETHRRCDAFTLRTGWRTKEWVPWDEPIRPDPALDRWYGRVDELDPDAMPKWWSLGPVVSYLKTLPMSPDVNAAAASTLQEFVRSAVPYLVRVAFAHGLASDRLLID